MLILFFKLLVGHALADFALQPEAMAKGKNRQSIGWPYWLLSHSLIAGGIVYYITQNIWLGIAETILHCVIDFMKCENVTNPHIDQLLHLVCRLCYLIY